MAYVVAISGISGAGKSSVIRRTAEILGSAAVLYFDDYAATSTYPPDLKDWAERGANVDEFQTPQLAADLRSLRDGPNEVVLVEEPFGTMRREMSGLIDLAIHLDVPGDVLLARRLMRRIEEQRDSAELIARMEQDMRHHLAVGRNLDALGSAELGKAADVVVDATMTVDEIAERVAAEIRQRL